MKISLCMIVRDEAANLERLLQSVRPHVDEICVVDTGSTDESPAIAKRFADKFEVWTGCNDAEGRIQDFSAARNQSFAMASHEVALWLDGDDELVGGESLRKLTEQAPAGAWSFIARYDYDPNTVQWRERLVYPLKGFEWRGPVHEGLLGKAGTVPQSIQTDAFHVVHRRHELRKAHDPERNLRILRAWFAANGESDARLMHYFGAELLHNHKVGEGLYWLRRHVAVSPWSDERCLSLMHLSRVAFALQDHLECARWALEAVATKSWPEPWWMLGQAYLGLSQQGIDADYNLRRGLHMLERGFRLDGDPTQRTLLMVDPNARYEAHGWLAPALARVGRLDEAIKSAETGLSGLPGHGPLTQNLHEWKRVRVMQGVAELEQMGAVKPDASAAIAAVLAGKFAPSDRPLRPAAKVETLETGPQPRKLMAHGVVPSRVRDGDSGLPTRQGRALPDDVARYRHDAVLQLRLSPERRLRIAFWLGHQIEPWTPETLEANGMGGSETMAWELSRRLAKLGHMVHVYAHPEHDMPDGQRFDGVYWHDASKFTAATDCDVLIVSRQAAAVTLPHTATARVLWVHDVHCGPDFTPQVAVHYDLIWCLSQWHKRFFCETYPWLGAGKVEVTRNGIDPGRFVQADASLPPRNPHRAIYSSSPDRGLAEAVAAWPSVRAAIPDAELHCFYGFDNWEKSLQLGGENGNPNCSRAALERLKKAVAETPGVFMRGRVNQKQLAEEMLQSGVWAYDTWFSETSCITAMEAQAAGLFCVCQPVAALAETVQKRWWSSQGFVESVVSAMQATERDEHDVSRFSLDSLALEWENRLLRLVETQRANVVPVLAEAAQ